MEGWAGSLGVEEGVDRVYNYDPPCYKLGIFADVHQWDYLWLELTAWGIARR